jgi:hypothetical protein
MVSIVRVAGEGDEITRKKYVIFATFHAAPDFSFYEGLSS